LQGLRFATRRSYTGGEALSEQVLRAIEIDLIGDVEKAVHDGAAVDPELRIVTFRQKYSALRRLARLREAAISGR
jgi:hypothetical protein